jgi:hypothetical protein
VNTHFALTRQVCPWSLSHGGHPGSAWDAEKEHSTESVYRPLNFSTPIDQVDVSATKNRLHRAARDPSTECQIKLVT